MFKVVDVFYGIELGFSVVLECFVGCVIGGVFMLYCIWILCEWDKVYGGVGVE